MTRIDRLVQARQKQRESAAEELGRAREQLETLVDSETCLLEEARRQVAGDGDRPLTPETLEQLDTARRCARRGTVAGEDAVELAHRSTLQAQLQLRQVEILRERLRLRNRERLTRKERKETDEIAARLRRLLITLLLLLMLPLSAGCQEGELHAATTASDAGKASAGPRCPDETFSVEELALLRKLRTRQKQLAASEQALAAREAAAALMEARVKVMLGELKRLQSNLGRPDGARLALDPRVLSDTSPDATPSKVDLVRVLKGMNARAAAAMLALMDPGLAAAALRRLEVPQVGRLLAQMPSEAAAAIGTHLAPRAPMPATSDVTSAAPMKPAPTEPARTEPAVKEPAVTKPAVTKAPAPRAARRARKPKRTRTPAQPTATTATPTAPPAAAARSTVTPKPATPEPTSRPTGARAAKTASPKASPKAPMASKRAPTTLPANRGQPPGTRNQKGAASGGTPGNP